MPKVGSLTLSKLSKKKRGRKAPSSLPLFLFVTFLSPLGVTANTQVWEYLSIAGILLSVFSWAATSKRGRVSRKAQTRHQSEESNMVLSSFWGHWKLWIPSDFCDQLSETLSKITSNRSFPVTSLELLKIVSSSFCSEYFGLWHKAGTSYSIFTLPHAGEEDTVN